MKIKFILSISSCFLLLSHLRAQTVDTAALQILKKSFDKVAQLHATSYQTIFKDTNIGDAGAEQHIDTALVDQFEIGKCLYRFRNNKAFLATKDSIYCYTESPRKQVEVFSKNSDHELLELTQRYSIYNLVGHHRNFLKSDIESIKFNDAEWNDKVCVIDIFFRTGKDSNGIIERIKRFYRIFIDKDSMLPLKQLYFSEWTTDRFEHKYNIYEYEITFSEPHSTLAFPLSVFWDLSLRAKKNIQPEVKTPSLTGSKAPLFEATNTLTQQITGLSKYRGKVVLLDFWYLGCLPCREMMPALQRLHNKYKNLGLVVLGVNVKDKKTDIIKSYLANKGFTYPQLYKPSDLKSYEIKAYPTTVLIDRKGNVILYESGYYNNFEKDISALVDTTVKK